ncbi:transporter [Bacillus sp. FJAT-27225]|uniref:DMT family transporter n=1 Tax=Bacillus sp. FJAT-27225 TaxID=1743144 RepID=UPI00080C22F8|nr:DMT family transporter [Bacillus sp. FJAT-27225]OCA87947.1 transporter [Bacillus sp. FJAT-27225]
MKKATYLGYMSATLNALIVGLSFLFTKQAVEASSPLDTLAFRFTAAFLAVSFLMAIKVIKTDFGRFRQYLRVLPLTLLYPTSFFIFQAYGLETISSSEAGILSAIIPILTLILASIFLRERTNLLQKLSIVISVGGVIFIFVMKGSSISFADWKGIIYMMLSCLSIAGYTVMARKLTKEYDPIEITYFMLGVGFLIFNVIAIGLHLYNGTLSSFAKPMTNPGYIVAILFLGVLASFLTSLLSNFAISKIPASRMSVFGNMSTVISIVAGAVILNEDVYSYHIIGSILIIVGVLGTNYFGEKKEGDKPEKDAA